MKEIFVGIDLAIAKRKRLPICFCYWEGQRLVPIRVRHLAHEPPRGRGNLEVLDDRVVAQFVEEAATYIESVAADVGGKIKRIGIDAPRTPRIDLESRRKAEIAMDAAGINCFTTPSLKEFEHIFDKVRRHIANGGTESSLPHANQLWMFVGFRLFERLSIIAPCIEVFPQATVRAIGVGGIHKSKAGAVEGQLREAAKYTGWPSDGIDAPSFDEIGVGSAHDRLDAYLSAWVAALPESKRVAMGRPPNDVIWVPMTDNTLFTMPSVPVSTGKPHPIVKTSQPPSSFEKSCPACGKHTFKRWPYGWDAHAAHKCTGLNSSGADNRKAEYRKRYGILFPGKGGL